MEANMNERSNPERYAYLLSTVVKQQEIWLLKARDGFYAMFEDGAKQSYLPVWPDKEYAQGYATGDWEEYEPEAMSLKEFLEWLPELKEDEIKIGAFPNSNSESMGVDAIDLKKQLIALSKGNSIQPKK
jgi:hypothetical protein